MTVQADPEAGTHRPFEDAIVAADAFALAEVHQHRDLPGGWLRPAVLSAINGLIANASLAAERLASAEIRLPALIASLQATAQRAGNGTADLQQGLIPLLRDMQATAQNLREVTDSLRRYPAQVFAQPPPRTTEPAR